MPAEPTGELGCGPCERDAGPTACKTHSLVELRAKSGGRFGAWADLRRGEREQVLAVNYSVDALPFVRPSTSSTVLTGQPGGARKHRQTIPPLTSRWHSYSVDGDQLTGSGRYTATIQLKSAMVPVNLIHAIKGVGFDYGMSPRDIADGVVAGHEVLWEKTVSFDAN